MDVREIEKKIAAYDGKKVGIIVTGGGQGIAQLATIPGASKVLHAIHIPYSYEESARLIKSLPLIGDTHADQYLKKAVSESSAELLWCAGLHFWPECRVITCTSATTTNRWRRGENQAFIAIGDRKGNPPFYPDKVHHLELSKLTEEDYNLMGPDYVAWKRRAEDKKITNYILDLIFGE